MTSRYKFAGPVAVLLLVSLAVLYSARNLSAASEGKITGTIKLDGTPPHQRPIDMSKEPYCQKLHAAQPVTTEGVVVGSNGGLQNVVVYLSEGLSGAVASQVPEEKPKFDQKGCQYIPHVLAVDVNQHFLVTNSDPNSHNIHPLPKPGGPNNQWNKSQPPGSPPFDVTWQAEEVAIPVKCNIHPWMHGYMAVVKGPYGVSDGNGSYTVENVPPGNYTLTAWQETYGTQAQKIAVGAGKPATADFTFKAK
ncbi:MAG TPA: carboxypeptidase regulatory-like domain-containing protein [Terriglobales bacterium]|nr:carboxypeptidase regulatory-like domain-containing protein [Terriglobales bacterium]